MKKTPVNIESLLQKACTHLDVVHDAVTRPDHKQQIGDMIRSLLAPKGLLDVTQLSTVLETLSDISNQGWLKTRRYRHDLHEAQSALRALRDVRASNVKRIITYPSGPDGVQTEAYALWRNANDAQLQHHSHPVLVDVNRKTQLLGQFHSNFHDQGDTLSATIPIVRELDFICGIPNDTIDPLYQAYESLYLAIGQYDFSRCQSAHTSQNTLRGLALSILLDDKTQIEAHKNSFKQLIKMNSIGQDDPALLNALLDARTSFEANHPNLAVLRRFALAGAGQHISNDLYLASISGNLEHGIAPSIQIDGASQFMQGTFQHNITRRGTVCYLATDNEDQIFETLQAAKPGTYLLTQAGHDCALQYKDGDNLIHLIHLGDIPELRALTQRIEPNALESLSAEQRYRIEDVIGRYHEQTRRPEGDMVVVFHGDIKRFIHDGEICAIEPKTGALVGPMPFEIGYRYDGMDPACVVDMQIRVLADRGNILPILSYQSIQLNSAGIEHQAHLVQGVEYDAERDRTHDEVLSGNSARK